MSRSTPTTQQPTESLQPQGEPLGPKHYAPHLEDPDPPQKIMSPLELELFGRRVGDLMRKKGYWK